MHHRSITRCAVFLLNAFLFSLISPSLVTAVETLPSGLPVTSLATEIETFVADHQATTAGVNIAVFTVDDVLYRNAFGHADRDRSRPLSTDDVMEWGSITKLLTWVSVMQLEEAGKIDLDTDVRDYLPVDFTIGLKYKQPVTLSNLMNHQGGFGDKIMGTIVMVTPDYPAYTLPEALLRYEPEQLYQPGQISAYSNWGAALAAYTVEMISGIPFADYVHQNIFKPLNMNDTGLLPDLSDTPGLS